MASVLWRFSGPLGPDRDLSVLSSLSCFVDLVSTFFIVTAFKPNIVLVPGPFIVVVVEALKGPILLYIISIGFCVVISPVD